MSENWIKPRWLVALALELPAEVYFDVVEQCRAEIAAAEERGRRRGVEEAAKEIRAEANGNRGGDYELGLLRLAKRVDNLAPRDSGPGFSNADDPFADLVAARDRK